MVARGLSAAALAAGWGMSGAAATAELATSEEEPEFPAVSTAATSASRRFLATGGTAVENAALAQWAERAGERCAELVGQPLFPPHEGPLIVALRQDARYPDGRIIRAQGLAGGCLRQKLIVYASESVDPEELLEAFCWLLLNRWVYQRTGQAEGGAPPEVPDWVAVGVAQNLFPALRQRNSRMMAKAWREGRGLSWAELTGCLTLPPGRCLEKAAAGVACAWWCSLPQPEEKWEALLDRLAAGKPVTAEWVAEAAGLSAAAELEQAWDLWLAHRGAVRNELGKADVEDAAALMEAQRLDAELLRLVGCEHPPGDLTPAGLIAHRGARWMRPLALYVGFRVKQVAIGRSPEFQRVARLYASFWDGLASARGWSGPSRRALRRRLAEADQARARWEREAAALAPEEPMWPRCSEAPGTGAPDTSPLPPLRILPGPHRL